MIDYLFLSAGFNRYAGPNNHLLDLANYLHKTESVVLATNKGIVEPDFQSEIKFTKVAMLERARHISTNVSVIKKLIAKYRPRVLFVNSDINLAFQTYLATMESLNIGYNVFLGNLSSGGFFKKTYGRVLDKLGHKMLIEKIFAHSQFHKTMLTKLGVDEDRIHVLPHCIDLNRIERAGNSTTINKSSEIPRVLFVGSLKQHKGIIELLSACQQIITKIELTIVGRGPLKSKVEETIRQTEKGNLHIIHFDRLTLSKLMSLIKNADVVTVPSHREFFGLIALEAMSLKKAVLATCFGGITEVITDGVDGVLVDPFDATELQGCLEELVSDPSKREKLGWSAYETVKKNYQVSVVAPKFMKLLET